MRRFFVCLFCLAIAVASFSQTDAVNNRILKIIDEITGNHKDLYIDLHKNPELSLMEFETSEKMAVNLESLGFQVTKGVGGNGVVGVFKNGGGKVIMLRTDMDALPMKETTGLPYASNTIGRDASGAEVPVMHACGHDLHMAVWLGTLTTLVRMKDQWNGTIVAVAQPAEEIGAGAMDMINDGLFSRFPVPDYALAYHVSADMPAGMIGYYPGPIFAGVRSVDMKVFGSGGHGAMPHTTIDPIVLAARIILDLQTIVSREINPVKPAVVTVGSIKAGTKHNIIPNEVEMLLTIRFFEDTIYKQIMEAINRISRGIALSAGLTEDRIPLVTFSDQITPPTINNSGLVLTSVNSMRDILGHDKAIQVDPLTVAEDFGRYGRTPEDIPIALFWLGGVNHDLYRDHLEKGTFLPPLHNSGFAPDFIPAFRSGVAAMSKAIIDILGEK
jgi:amidohydrolase